MWQLLRNLPMKNLVCLSLLFLFPLFLAHALRAEHRHSLQCRHAAPFLAGVDTTTQRYAPERQVDIVSFALDVTPDFKNRRVAGTATFTVKTMLKPVEQLRLDAFDLEVSEIKAGPKIAV